MAEKIENVTPLHFSKLLIAKFSHQYIIQHRNSKDIISISSFHGWNISKDGYLVQIQMSMLTSVHKMAARVERIDQLPRFGELNEALL